MSRSLLRRLTPLVSARIQFNSRLLSSSLQELSNNDSHEPIHMTENCIQVATNPCAVGGCSCKSSFMVK